jgi:Xaa-Pro aminopeptidase
MSMREVAIPTEEFKSRAARIQEQSGEQGLDAILLFGDEHQQGNVRYVSDYRPMLEYSAIIIPVRGEAILLAGPECATLAHLTSKIEDIRICSDLQIPGEEYPNTPMVSIEQVLKELDGYSPIKKLGVVDMDFLPLFIAESVKRGLAGRELVDVSMLLHRMRAVKSENEIKVMRKAYEAGSLGLRVGMKALEVGKRETDIAAEMAYPMWLTGADQMSHCFMVASGKRSSPALSFPTDKKRIEDGDLVILDVGIVYEGYFSDNAVTVIAGTADPEHQRIIDVAAEAKAAAIAAAKPGALGWEVDKAARDIIEAVGYGPNCIYGVGHGVGLQHCEYPMCGPTSDFVLEEGMVFSIDVGLFNFPFGGVRMEDGILITSEGVEVLTRLEE